MIFTSNTVWSREVATSFLRDPAATYIWFGMTHRHASGGLAAWTPTSETDSRPGQRFSQNPTAAPQSVSPPRRHALVAALYRSWAWCHGFNCCAGSRWNLGNSRCRLTVIAQWHVSDPVACTMTPLGYYEPKWCVAQEGSQFLSFSVKTKAYCSSWGSANPLDAPWRIPDCRCGSAKFHVPLSAVRHDIVRDRSASWHQWKKDILPNPTSTRRYAGGVLAGANSSPSRSRLGSLYLVGVRYRLSS